MDNELFASRLRQRLKELNMTQADLARASGVSPPLVSDYVKGRYFPKKDKLDAIIKTLRVSEEWLTGKTTKQAPTQSAARVKATACIPVLSFSSGKETIRETVTVECNDKNETFALRVPDNSMEPRIAEGDIAILTRCYELIDGVIMLLFVEDAYALRRIHLKDSIIILEAFNALHSSLILTNEEAQELPVIPRGILRESRVFWK